jgi:hypothetical protein
VGTCPENARNSGLQGSGGSRTYIVAHFSIDQDRRQKSIRLELDSLIRRQAELVEELSRLRRADRAPETAPDRLRTPPYTGKGQGEPCPLWKDPSERCGRGFAAGEPRWIEQRRYTVHSECADWSKWEQPPYLWKLKELRKRYRSADAQTRTRIVTAGKAIRTAQAQWPVHAVDHVKRVLEAVHRLR